MGNGIPLEATFEWQPGRVGHRTGMMRVQVGSLADYRAVVSRLVQGTIVYDPQGRAQRMRIADPDERPPKVYPAQATLQVVEQPLRDHDPRDRMSFGNNILQAGTRIDVIALDPPSEEGNPGRLVVRCDDADAYAELRKFVDEPHGSHLAAWDGRGSWYVNRVSDTGNPDLPFPQTVTGTLRWLRLE